MKRSILPGILLLAILMSPPACRDGAQHPGCDGESLGVLKAFLEAGGIENATPFTASVLDVPPPGTGGLTRVILRKDDGVIVRLVLGIPGEPIPVREGDTYGFVVDSVPGFPSSSGILIRDADGNLLFAGASDQAPGQTVLRGGVAGFNVELKNATCDSRKHSECYDAIRNAPLRVSHDGKETTLWNGESAFLGDYRVVCLVAQEVDYNSNCQDAGQVAVSYYIRYGRPSGVFTP